MSKAKGSVTWVPVESQTYWTVNLRGLSVNSTVARTNIFAVRFVVSVDVLISVSCSFPPIMRLIDTGHRYGHVVDLRSRRPCGGFLQNGAARLTIPYSRTFTDGTPVL